MSVVVDADSQRVVGKFPATPEGDEDLLQFLRTGDLGTQDGEAQERDDRAVEEGRAEGREPASRGTDAEATLRRLLRENRAEQRRAAGRISDLEAQERDLRRLLRAAAEGR